VEDDGKRFRNGDRSVAMQLEPGTSSMIAVRVRDNVLWARVNFPTIDGMSTVACGTPGNGER
jgi:hypothetical protein